MNRRMSHLSVTGLCLLAAFLLCPTAQADSTTFWPKAVADHTGSVRGPTPLSSEIVASRSPYGSSLYHYQEVGYTRFNLPSVIEDMMILSVTIHYYINTSSGRARYSLTPLEFDPLVTSDLWIAWDISADAGRNPYVESTDDSVGWHQVDLGTSSIHDLRNSIGSEWFGVGFHNHDSGIRVDGWAETNTPYLVVEHRPGPLTYHVDDDSPFDPGPGDPAVSDPAEDGSATHPFDSIQEAVDAAYWDGGSIVETVMVADGLYTGTGNRDIDLGGNVLHIRSANGPEHCIIDCQGSAAEPHRGFLLKTEGTYTVLEGFTITGGYEERGGAIVCTTIFGRPYSKPVIRGNVITGNTTSSTYTYGGGIDGSSGWSSPLITGNVIIGNQALGTSAKGGGVYCLSGAVTDNLITGNQALGTSAKGGGVYTGGNVSNNTITGNHAEQTGGGIYCDYYSFFENHQWGVVANNVVSENTAATAAGIAFAANLHHCTVTGNIASQYAGGFRAGYDSVITDCIIAGNEAPVGNELWFGGYTHSVSHSNIDRNLNDVYEGYGAVVNWGPGMLDANPRFTSGAEGDFYLEQIAAGQVQNSVCLDAGSDAADQIQVPLAFNMTDGTTSWAPISDRTTATNFDQDTGTVDMGFHYPASLTLDSRLDITPSAGLLPFSTQITATLENRYTGQTRRIAGRLDADLAGGTSYTSWRAGWSNIIAGSEYSISWTQSIPALQQLLGENQFTLRAWDVTPAPYNQSPYPAAGDSDSDTATVTGIAP